MRGRLPRHAPALVPTLALALTSGACASFNPYPIETIPFKARAQTQTRHRITVTTAVPSRDEARKILLELKNTITERLLLSSIDGGIYEIQQRSLPNRKLVAVP